MSRIPPDLGRAENETRLVVRPEEDGLRLDRFLRARFPWRSREHLKERIREGSVTVNGGPGKASRPVRPGDEILVTLRRRGDPFDPADIPLPVLYEDEVLVAIDKPAGYVVHPVGRHQMDTIINALHLRYRRTDDPARDVVPKLAHRLDQHTSGVLLVAKRDDVRAELGRQFAEREVEKEYRAVVAGRPDPPSGEVEAPIARDPEARNGLPMRVHEYGEPSLTLYETLEDYGTHAYLRLLPKSGRTHQIRVHMQWIGTPLVADGLYGDGRPLVVDGETILDRYPLHSARLTFRHPLTGERLTITAPLPPDMERAREVLRRG